jgi:hypothetical protein
MNRRQFASQQLLAGVIVRVDQAGHGDQTRDLQRFFSLE